MASLVADYGDSNSESENEAENQQISKVENITENRNNANVRMEKESQASESEDSESDVEDEQIAIKESTTPARKLPKPDFAPTSSVSGKTSVFANPFVEAENAKSAILEKHVKMVPTKDNMQQINGKKICWNYRKGRCRFGHNCTFAHDSDLQKTEQELETEMEKKIQNSVVCESTITNVTNAVTKPKEGKRKRPGLTQGLVPGKKVMKTFKKHQSATSPWTINK